MNNNGTGTPMGNPNANLEKYLMSGTKSLKDYILLLRNNLKYIFIISLSIVILAAIYAYLAKNIYTSTASVRITNPHKNVLENGLQNIDNTYVDQIYCKRDGDYWQFCY